MDENETWTLPTDCVFKATVGPCLKEIRLRLRRLGIEGMSIGLHRIGVEKLYVRVREDCIDLSVTQSFQRANVQGHSFVPIYRIVASEIFGQLPLATAHEGCERNDSA